MTARPLVLLTHKPGHFRTDIGEGLKILAQYDYRFAGRHIARFVVAQLLGATHVTLVDEEPPYRRNPVPVKFLPRFDSLASAEAELRQLVRSRQLDTRLTRVGATETAA